MNGQAEGCSQALKWSSITLPIRPRPEPISIAPLVAPTPTRGRLRCPLSSKYHRIWVRFASLHPTPPRRRSSVGSHEMGLLEPIQTAPSVASTPTRCRLRRPLSSKYHGRCVRLASSHPTPPRRRSSIGSHEMGSSCRSLFASPGRLGGFWCQSRRSPPRSGSRPFRRELDRMAHPTRSTFRSGRPHRSWSRWCRGCPR